MSNIEKNRIELEVKLDEAYQNLLLLDKSPNITNQDKIIYYFELLYKNFLYFYSAFFLLINKLKKSNKYKSSIIQYIEKKKIIDNLLDKYKNYKAKNKIIDGLKQKNSTKNKLMKNLANNAYNEIIDKFFK